MAEVLPFHRQEDEEARCRATTTRRTRCRNLAVDERGLCAVHLRAERTAAERSRPRSEPGRPRTAPAGEPARDVVEDSLEFLRRRLSGQYEVDEFGFDPELTDKVLAPLARPFIRNWWRVEWRGMDRVPDRGPALLVANHAGSLPWDALVVKFGVLDQHPAHRHVRLLAADVAFRLPFVSPLARKSGNTLACEEDALRLLALGELLGVFPEGYKGVGKPFRDRYRLQRFGRGGFIEIALRARAPIVPVAIVGSEEIYPLLGQARPLARVLGLPYIPITPFFPWLGPLGLIPLPSKWIVEFGEPLDTTGYPDDAWQDGLTVLDLTERVREDIHQMLHRNLTARRSVFF